MTTRVSVCICTFNGARRIGRVLDALARQDAPAESWEVLVIDNASTDDTAVVAGAELARHFGDRGRLVHEEQAGLTYARRRAGLEARGDIVCFFDDDNLAEPDFVRHATRIFDEHLKLGCAGGKVLPEWEQEPTPLAGMVASLVLAICDQGDEPFVYSWVAWGPVGAGMCIRRDLLRQICDDPVFCASVTDRKGDTLSSGGDMALDVRVYQAGFERRYEPSLRLRHELPASRMAKEYLLRLYEGTGRGQAAVRRLWARGGQWRAMGLVMAARDASLWLRGALFGPAARPPITSIHTARVPDRALRRDLHEAEQRLLLGRIAEAAAFALRRPRAAKSLPAAPSL